MTTLEKIRAEIEKKMDEPEYQHEGDDWGVGLEMALGIIDRYAEQEPMKASLNGVFLKLSELGIQDMVCAEEVYRLIHITYEIGFNTGFNEAKAEQEPTSRVKNELKVELNELEPCDDVVSRQAIQELPKHLMKTEGMPFPKSEYFVKLDDLMRLQSVQPCEDAVSRAELLNKSWEVEFNGEYIQVIDVGDILDVPPVHPKQKTGHWKRISMDKYTTHAQYWYECDKCGEHNLGNTNYCPNCGAKMVEPKESEDKG